jgi:hypothetical protein
MLSDAESNTTFKEEKKQIANCYWSMGKTPPLMGVTN